MTHLGLFFLYNVMPMVMYPTREKKKVASQTVNFSINRMQRSIFSNTVYKNRTSPVKRRQASCVFKDSNFSVHPHVKNCSVLIQLLHTSQRRKKKRKKQNKTNKTNSLPGNEASAVLDFITVSLLSQYPNGSSLMQFLFKLCLTDVRKMSNLSRCLAAR